MATDEIIFAGKLVFEYSFFHIAESEVKMAAEMQALQTAVDKMMSELDVTAVRKFQKKVRFGWATRSVSEVLGGYVTACRRAACLVV